MHEEARTVARRPRPYLIYAIIDVQCGYLINLTVNDLFVFDRTEKGFQSLENGNSQGFFII